MQSPQLQDQEPGHRQGFGGTKPHALESDPQKLSMEGGSGRGSKLPSTTECQGSLSYMKMCLKEMQVPFIGGSPFIVQEPPLGFTYTLKSQQGTNLQT